MGVKAADFNVENRLSDLKGLFMIVGTFPMTHKSQKHYIINEPCERKETFFIVTLFV